MVGGGREKRGKGVHETGFSRDLNYFTGYRNKNKVSEGINKNRNRNCYTLLPHIKIIFPLPGIIFILPKAAIVSGQAQGRGKCKCRIIVSGVSLSQHSSRIQKITITR